MYGARNSIVAKTNFSVVRQQKPIGITLETIAL